MHDVQRRRFLQTTGAGGLALGLGGGSLLSSASALAQNNGVSWSVVVPGFTPLVIEYMLSKGFDRKHGFSFNKPIAYSSVTTAYNDFFGAGNYDVCFASWDTVASRYLAGVPVQLVCGITTASLINIIVPKNGATSIQELQGKTLAAPQSTGTYRITRALIRELTGFDIETSMRVQNVDNASAPITLAMAQRVDAALSWEPYISAGIKRVPDMRVLYNTGDEYKKKTGLDLPYFGIAIRKEAVARDPSLPGKINRAFADCLASLTRDAADVSKHLGATGIDPDVLKLAMSSGRMQFKHISMADPVGRQTIKTAADFLVRNGMLPRTLDDGIFAS